MSSNPHNLDTRAVHAGRAGNPTSAVSMPIFQSSNFQLGTAASAAELCASKHPAELYTRWGNPTTAALEAALADLEGGEAALAFSSGMGAGAAAVLATVKAGDHVVAADCLYAGMTELLERFLASFGVETTFVDGTDSTAFAAAMRDNTSLIYVETPANPTLAITDLAAIAELGRSHGVTTIADNTWASPVNQRPLALGLDGVVHSVTKYLAGHSDVVAGAVIGKKDWIEKVWMCLKIFGACISPNDAWLTLRGLKTLPLRVRRHNQNALRLAQWLTEQPQVQTVHFPGLAEHPGHATAARQMDGFGGMLTFEMQGGVAAGRQFIEALELVVHAVSLGGVETLVSHPASTTHAPLTAAERHRAGITDGLVRVSVGLEHPDDLIADFARALGATASVQAT